MNFKSGLIFAILLLPSQNTVKNSTNMDLSSHISNAVFDNDGLDFIDTVDDSEVFDHAEVSIMFPDSFDSADVLSQLEKEDSYAPAAINFYLRSAAKDYFQDLKAKIIDEYHINPNSLMDFEVPYPFFTFSFDEGPISTDNYFRFLNKINIYTIPKEFAFDFVNVYKKATNPNLEIAKHKPDYSFSKAVSVTGLNQIKDVGDDFPPIGILEPLSSERYLQSTNLGYFGNSTIFDNGTDWRRYSHISKVASIITGADGICPNSDVYCYLYGDSIYSVFNDLAKMIEKGVQIVNRSYHTEVWNKRKYNLLHAKYEKIAENNNILLIADSGNSESPEYEAISVPGSCYNVITVGSTNILGTEVSDFSMYKTRTKNQVKPDVVAPGEFNIPYDDCYSKGTSFSTPLVTSEVAQLMRNYHCLIQHPESVFALLTSTSDSSNFSQHPSGLPQIGGFDQKYGAGLIRYDSSFKNANNIIPFNLDYSDGFVDTSLIHVKSRSKFISSSFWFAEAIVDDSTQSSKINITDYDLSLYAKDGQQIACSSATGTNVVRFETLVEPGDYFLKISRKGTKNTSGKDRGAISYMLLEIGKA